MCTLSLLSNKLSALFCIFFSPSWLICRMADGARVQALALAVVLSLPRGWRWLDQGSRALPGAGRVWAVCVWHVLSWRFLAGLPRSVWAVPLMLQSSRRRCLALMHQTSGHEEEGDKILFFHQQKLCVRAGPPLQTCIKDMFWTKRLL